jgi:hypothetical protein
MMDGYSITEAASVLGVPTERVWELLARGVLAGAPEGETGMRVFLQPRQAPTPVTASFTDEPDSSRSNGPDRELSPFRELLTEFRNLTERYGQALLALGESRGEVASLRSRVDLLEARIDFRLPMGNPAPPWPTQPPPATEPAGEGEDEEAHRRRRRGARRATESFAEALARAEDPSPADLPGGTGGASFVADAAAEDADGSLPRDVLPAEPVLVAEEEPGAAVAEADEAEPPIAAIAGAPTPELMPDRPEPMVDEPEPIQLERAVVLDQVEAVAFEPSEAEFDDLQLAHAGAWAIPADLADEAAAPEPDDEDLSADASPAAEELEWSLEADSEPMLDIVPDEELEFVIEVEALPDLPEGEPATEPALDLAPEEERTAAAADQSAVEPEPEAVDFDAERYTSIIDQPDWFAAEADDWSMDTTSGEATGASDENEGRTAALEPPFREPDAPEPDAPEPESPESGADEMEVAGGGQVAAAEPKSPSEGELPGSRELDEALEAYGDLGTHETAAREVDEEWPPATPGAFTTASSAQGTSGYISPPPYRSTMPSSAGTRAYRRLRRIFPT